MTSEAGMPISVFITAYVDASFDFVTNTPPASFFLKKAAKIKKGSGITGKETVGSATMAQSRDSAGQRMGALNATDLDAGATMIAGTARSMGLAVVE